MNKNSLVFKQISKLVTEKLNHKSTNIDRAGISRILKIIHEEDKNVYSAVEKEIRFIAKAVNLVVNSFKKKGRLIYVGAGTSGRMGIIDAAECPPTFGTSPGQVQGIIAGGKKAVFVSQEGVEDNEKKGARDICKLKITSKDVVCGITASARTPYVIGAIKEAKKNGSKTIYITTNPRKILRQRNFIQLRKSIDIAICPVVGPEVIMGSTRMKSGTAQKMILNMITTAAMIRTGKIYRNMMVDLQRKSKKLKERAKRVLMIVTNITYDEATQYLKETEGNVKTAIVMIKMKTSKEKAQKLLKNADGFLHKIIEN